MRFELDHHVNLRPSRLHAGVDSPLGRKSRHRLRRRPRGHRGPVHRHRRRDPRRHAARGRHRGQPEHRLRRRARGPRRVRAGGQPPKNLTLVHKTNVLTFAGKPVVAHRRRGGSGVPRRRRRIPARRRGHDPHGHRPGALRRDRHRQPVRRHHHRPRAPRCQVGSGWPPAATSTRRGPSRRCSSPCTAVPRTSRAQGIADPTAAVTSVALLLAHLGEDAAAARVDAAVAKHLATRDDETRSTSETGDRILSLL